MCKEVREVGVAELRALHRLSILQVGQPSYEADYPQIPPPDRAGSIAIIRLGPDESVNPQKTTVFCSRQVKEMRGK